MNEMKCDMYISGPCYVQFVLCRALFYRTAVTPCSSCLSDVVKLMIKEMNSDTCTGGIIDLVSEVRFKMT